MPNTPNNPFDTILEKLNKDQKVKDTINQMMFKVFAKNHAIAGYDLRTLIPVVDGMENLQKAAVSANALDRAKEVDGWLVEIGNLSKALWFTRELVHRMVEMMTSPEFTPEFRDALAKDYKAFLATSAMGKDEGEGSE